MNKKRKSPFTIHYSLFTILSFLAAGCAKSPLPQAIWCDTGTAPGEVVYPRGIAYCKSDDTFFIVDRMARIQHLDHDGKPLALWKTPSWAYGKPVGLSVGPDGNIWVPDTHYHRILVYSTTGKLVMQFGSEGTAPGQFIYPTDVKFDARGNVLISEYGDNDRVQIFDIQGHYRGQFGHFGQGDGEFSRPETMVIDGDTLYLTDACNHRICVFTVEGKFIRNMGHVGSALGEFRFPYGLDQDKNGHLIVCEFGNNRVQLIDKQTGRGIATWGNAGRAPGELAYPWGVAVDREGRVVAVDAGNNRLQVFRF